MYNSYTGVYRTISKINELSSNRVDVDSNLVLNLTHRCRASDEIWGLNALCGALVLGFPN